MRKAIRGIFNFTDSIAGKIKMIAQIRVANFTNGVRVAVFRCIGGLINWCGVAATMVDLLILSVEVLQKNLISGKMRLPLEECEGNLKYARFAD